MELNELKQKNEKELQQLLKEHRTTLQRLRFEVANGQLKQVRRIKQERKDIAQLLTEIHSRATLSTRA